MFEKPRFLCSESESVQAEGKPSAKTDWITVVLALAGFATAVYALVEHIRAKAGGAGSLSCDINAVVSCSNVLTSEYGEVIGIPLGAFGMSFWAGILAVGLLPRFVRVSERYLAFWRLLSATIGFVTALVLAYLAYVVLKAVCPVCSATQILCVLYFAYALVKFLKHKGDSGESSPNAFMRLLSLVLAFSVPPVILGFIIPPIAVDSMKKKQVVEAAKAEPSSPTETPIPAELLKVNKSNFVGKGEDYRMGNDDARVVIHVFTDPECPACRVAGSALEQAVNTVGLDKVLYVAHMYPLDSSCNTKSGMLHPQACRLSMAARCAGQQGKFWEVLHWAYQSQTLPDTERAVAFSDSGIEKKVSSVGVALPSFKQCMDAKVELPKIQEDIELGNSLGLTGTPLLIINGRKFRGNHGDPAVLVATLRAELGL